MDPDRRQLLKGTVGLTAFVLPAGSALSQAAFKADPFTLGIASGDPSRDGFVLWTRLAPQPLYARGGMTTAPVDVAFEVARDDAMRDVVRSGTALARVDLAHSVHVQVDGLEPGRDYFYRFRAGGAESPVGRARTLPAPGASVAQIRFASAGCQAWEGGYYTAWRHIADEHFDFVAHYGDYIYEYAAIAPESRTAPLARGMPRDFGTCYTLTELTPALGLDSRHPARSDLGYAGPREGRDLGMRRVWRDGYRYNKAGVVTVDLVPLAGSQRALIDALDRRARRGADGRP